MRIDVHQHLWSEPLVEALASRRELPFVRRESGVTVLYAAGERPYVIDQAAERPQLRAALVERDGLDRALLCLSSPLGIEGLPRAQARALLDAYHDGALALPGSFGAWGAVALDRADPRDVDSALDRGCVGISLPAGALADVSRVAAIRPLLARLEDRGAPLLVHPGPGLPDPDRRAAGQDTLADPLWWPALTRYVAEMHAAWHAFLAAGRRDHRRLRVIFTMLAGLAPLHAERLASRGGPAAIARDPHVFYETSSYGRAAAAALAALVGPEQLLYGSDRPVVEPGELGIADALDWDLVIDGTRRALGAGAAGLR